MRNPGAIAFLLAFVSGGNVAASETSLPSVIILGYQISQQSASELKKELKGKVEFHYPRLELERYGTPPRHWSYWTASSATVNGAHSFQLGLGD